MGLECRSWLCTCDRLAVCVCVRAHVGVFLFYLHAYDLSKPVVKSFLTQSEHTEKTNVTVIVPHVCYANPRCF